MVIVNIFGRDHFKDYSDNKFLIKEIKNADLILVEGVSHNSLLTWENFKREPLIITFMLLYYLLLRLSSTLGKNDIDSIRLLLRREGKKFYKDWFFPYKIKILFVPFLLSFITSWIGKSFRYLIVITTKVKPDKKIGITIIYPTNVAETPIKK